MHPIRLLVAAVVAAVVGAVALPGCGSDGAAAPAPTVTSKQCRFDWENERQALGENGNPAARGTVLARRYDEIAATATRLATTAKGSDCPQRLEDYKTKVNHYFDLEFAVRRHDMLSELAIAEGDLRHAVATRSYDPLPAELAQQFAILRAAAPAARAALQPALDEAAAAELTAASVKAVDRDLDAAADDVAAYRECRRALAVIARYELSEE